ncbi:MAG TPA: T9SS type A sorting domain-containing protein [Chitinophagaceae bacterium]|nr:T9SS type A sorting domain-containing protein [Chitinophagaceae bacterium]
MRKFYSVITVMLALTISATAQKRLIKATASGNWTSASTWTTIGSPTPTDNDSIVIQTGISVTIGTSGGSTINLQNVIVDIFGALVFDKPNGASKSNDLNITTATTNPIPVVRLASGASISASSGGNGKGNIYVIVNGTTTQVKYSTASVSGVLAGQTAGPIVTGPAFAQNTASQPQYFTTGANASLPVSISVFKAAISDNNVTLNWTSLQEINTQSFVIEKSTNGSNWQQIGSLPAAGFSGVATKYQFVDGAAATINYYRLKTVDLDGKFNYSNTLVIRSKNTAVNVSVFPNPAVNSVNITISHSLAQQGLTINLLNHNGQLMTRRQIADGSNTNTLSLDLSNYKTGTYTLDILFSGGTREAHKLTIVK